MVRNAIYDTAIELFVKKGFDDTTGEEVAEAAGISRRSFFRHFATKDDQMAQSVVNYGKALVSAVADCPSASSPLEMVRETVSASANCAASEPALARQSKSR